MDKTGGLITTQAPRQCDMLGTLRRLGTVGGATTLALAIVLAGMLLVAAALTLTVVLTLAGMLGLGRVLGEKNSCVRGLNGGAVRLGRLSVQTNRGAADQTCKRGGQSERFYCGGHRNKPFIG
jgi:hypothetical protein